MGAFAMALCGGRFSGPRDAPLVEGTIQGAISYVALSFRDNNMPNPTKEADGELGQVLSRLFRAFKNGEKPEKQQSAIPICVVNEVSHKKATETDRAIGQLAVAAYFFACCSCEYLKVPQAEKRCTDILRLQNIRFFKEGQQIHHRNNSLEYTDCVSVTFEWQKQDVRQDTVTQLSTGDLILCPV
eukprot:8595847-Ditylum_brightwellii.AAC.1